MSAHACLIADVGGYSTGTRPAFCANLQCARTPRVGRPSRRTGQVAAQFGIALHEREVTILESTRVLLAPGQLVAIVGPSGSGKSSALGEIERQFPIAHNVQRVLFNTDAALIDQIAPWASLSDAANLLTSCGLSEPRLWLRTFDGLSEGEKFRARLARSIAMHERAGCVAPVLCDEFCSNLHRRAAKAISFNLRKLVDRRRICLVIATSNEDVLVDLRPQMTVRLHGNTKCDIKVDNTPSRSAISFARRLHIIEGGKRDYDAFAAMHYRGGDELGFVSKVFLLREGQDGDVLGIVVYSHSPLELSLRNQTTAGWFVKSPRRVNQHLRILRRLVIHPDVRGCGLGHLLVRKTLPLVGTRFVECLAAMGEFNPVFEKAGMKRVGQYELTQRRKDAKNELEAMDIDPNAHDFATKAARIPRARRLIAKVVHDWYSATTGGGQNRVEKQSPELLAQTFRGLIATRPVYYLWKHPKVQTSKRPNTNGEAVS